MTKQGMVCGILALMLLVPLGCSKEQAYEQKISNQSPTMIVSATNFYNDYAKDEKQAAQKYKNKVIAVDGVVGSTGVSPISGTPWVKMNTGNARVDIFCMFGVKHKDEIAKLKQGQKITVKGKVGNKLHDIFLHGCTQQ